MTWSLPGRFSGVVVLAVLCAGCSTAGPQEPSAAPTNLQVGSPAVGTDNDVPGELPMRDAIVAGDVAAVAALLDAGADPTSDWGAGVTAVHWAAARDHREIVALLVENGANVNVRTDAGQTPLLLASTSASYDTVTWLLAHGADPTISSYALPTQNALHDAAAAGNADAVRALLDFGVDPNVRDANGSTPLLLTSWFGRRDAELALLAAGADTSYRDARGRTALDWALSRHDDAMASDLEAAVREAAG